MGFGAAFFYLSLKGSYIYDRRGVNKMAKKTRLVKNQQVKLLDGRTVTAIAKLGEGGQGSVYKVKVDGTNEEKALKWYFPEAFKEPKDSYNDLKDKIQRGAPSPAFIWPEVATEWVSGSFGFIMDIYPEEYLEFTKYVLVKVKFANNGAMVDAALNLVSAFKTLFNAGYSFQDLNYTNFVVRPSDGDVLIFDNCNVSEFGKATGILGYRRFMAPEIVRGEKTILDRISDRHSLAVNLFYILMGDHPLEGNKTNVPVLVNTYEKRFFGKEPLFIFDKDDKANRPQEGIHINATRLWPCYPKFVQEAFMETFSKDSLLFAKGRLLEQAWLHVLVRLKSSTIKCPYCNEEMFLECNSETVCQDCKKTIMSAGYFRFKNRRHNIEIAVPIYEGIKLYEYHMNETAEDYKTEAAVVLAKDGKFGLKNLSRHSWTISDKEGNSSKKTSGDVVVLGSNLAIDFGSGCICEVIRN